MTTSGSLVTLQFHSDDDDDDDDADSDNADEVDNRIDDSQSVMSVERPRKTRGRTYKGFWLRFEGSVTSC